jgi:hypothetical protein
MSGEGKGAAEAEPSRYPTLPKEKILSRTAL